MQINPFNTVIFSGGERSNYVSLLDLDQAATDMVGQTDNAAFADHWQDCDVHKRRVLSALAWATSETHRRQLDLDGMMAAIDKTRLRLPST